jgi:hypothetical protein
VYTREDQKTCTETFRELIKVDATQQLVQDWAQTDDGPLATCIESCDSAKLETMLGIIKPTRFPDELWRMIGRCSSIDALECLATYAATHFAESAALSGTELALQTAVKGQKAGFLLGYHTRSIEPQKSLTWWVQNSPNTALLKSIVTCYSRPQATTQSPTCVICLADVDMSNQGVEYSRACSCSAGVYHAECFEKLAMQKNKVNNCPQCRKPFAEVTHRHQFANLVRYVKEQQALKNRIARFDNKLKQTIQQRDDAINSLSATQFELDGLRKRARRASER